MADKNDILAGLLNQPPDVRPANTDNFFEKLHRSRDVTEKDFRKTFNEAVYSNLGFNVSISPNIKNDEAGG
jgi:hypothetical protein